MVPASEVEKRVAGFQTALNQKAQELAAARQLSTELQQKIASLEPQVQTARTEAERQITTLSAEKSTLTEQLAALQQAVAEKDAQINFFGKRDKTIDRISAINKDLVDFYKGGFMPGIEDLDDAGFQAKVAEFSTKLTSLLNPKVEQLRGGQTTNPTPAGAAVDVATWTDDQLAKFIGDWRGNGTKPEYALARAEYAKRHRPSSTQQNPGK